MPPILLVALGGAAGSVGRYLLAGAMNPAGVPTASSGWQAFPVGTFTVNLLGCAAIGLIAGWFAGLGQAEATAWRALLIVGVLGGFTTFSAFGMESLHLIRAGLWLPLATYVVASTVGGVALAGLGYMVTGPKL